MSVDENQKPAVLLVAMQWVYERLEKDREKH